MKIQIKNKIFHPPQTWKDLNKKQLRYIHSTTASDLYVNRKDLFFLLTGCSRQLVQEWEDDAQGIVTIDGEDFTEFQLEWEDVLRQSTAFLFKEIDKTNVYKKTRNIIPPFKNVGLGEGFKFATFNDFASIGKRIEKSDTDALVEYLDKNKRKKRWRPWQKTAIYHYAESCHGLIVDNLPPSMRTQKKDKKPSRFGMEMVMVAVAGEKLGNVQEVRNTNIWTIVTYLNHIDEENRKSKKK